MVSIKKRDFLPNASASNTPHIFLDSDSSRTGSVSSPGLHQNHSLLSWPKNTLTLSSGATSTTTEFGDDLIDVDYVSDHSLDLSYDEDDEENFEDIQSEIYLRNLLYSIDRLTFDDLITNSFASPFLIELPKNLAEESLVWRQKFKQQKLSQQTQEKISSKFISRKICEHQASIEKVMEWNSEFSPYHNSKLFATNSKEDNHNFVKADEASRKFACPTNSTKLQPISNRITLPPIVNTRHMQINRETQHRLTNDKLDKFDLKEQENGEQEKEQRKQMHPLHTSQSFTEQRHYSMNSAASGSGGSASSRYLRITLNDLLDQSSSNVNNVWTQRPSDYPQPSYMLKLPVIKL